MPHHIYAIAAAIALASATPALAQPETAPTPPQAAQPAAADFTDAQLTSFLAASEEIAVIQQRPSAATDPAAIEAMRASLTRHQLDAATYNAIAQRARSDEAFAARLAQLRATSQAQTSRE